MSDPRMEVEGVFGSVYASLSPVHQIPVVNANCNEQIPIDNLQIILCYILWIFHGAGASV